METNDHQMSPTTNFLVGEAEDDFIHDSGTFLLHFIKILRKNYCLHTTIVCQSDG